MKENYLECNDPGLVDEGDYLAHLGKDGRPEFEMHLAACSFCRQEVEQYRQVDAELAGHLRLKGRAGCCSTQQLGEYALGLLKGEDRSKVEQHLDSCAFCPGELESLGVFLGEPDPWLEPAPGGLTGQLRRVAARLLNFGPSQPGFRLAGLRGGPGESLLVYQAEEVQLTLTFREGKPGRSGGSTLEGLLQSDDREPEALEGTLVRLLKDQVEIGATLVDDIGNFAFSEIAPAAGFELEIALPDKLVTVEVVKPGRN